MLDLHTDNLHNPGATFMKQPGDERARPAGKRTCGLVLLVDAKKYDRVLGQASYMDRKAVFCVIYGSI